MSILLQKVGRLYILKFTVVDFIHVANLTNFDL